MKGIPFDQSAGSSHGVKHFVFITCYIFADGQDGNGKQLLCTNVLKHPVNKLYFLWLTSLSDKI